jgi:enoyl-CoA hydratase/carnithine racemase
MTIDASPATAVRVVLDGPGKNALSTPLMTRALADVRAAGDRPIVLTGAGDAFSAGLNLKELATLDLAGMERFLGLLGELVRALYLHPAPTVALVNGHAIAGGSVLALTCDLRVARADPSLRIGLNETALGLEFPPGILRLVRARISPHAIDRVVLEAGLHAPDEAARLGLVDEVSTDPEGAAAARVAALAAHPRSTYASAKRALRDGLLDETQAELRRYRDELLPLWASDGVKARIAAALARRGA